MHQTYDHCRLQNFRWRPERILASFEVLDQNNNIHEVYIQTRAERLYTDLAELAKGKRTQGIFSCGMTDIDFFRMAEGGVMLAWSPNEVTQINYILPTGELQKLIDWAATIPKRCSEGFRTTSLSESTNK